ncbi:hypothetical protein QR680_001890 [Steinernema hermaphroditum]|uniref:WAP domain-containing protein n=1 Tax=Steinernema hermaphroditum TaxID=289476 RepID=A0AA39H0A9_9BILA|nr:hypothetical protein QR680_001890 [Steinernema hermaphroditum]
MLPLLVLLLLSVSFAKDNIPYCPNGDAPKTDEAGTVIICLPGQSSKTVCGKGYSCFFSGYNYQCCPQGEDEEEEPLECPMNALTVLDAVGDPVKCDKAKCPKDTMFCSKQGSTAICCESLLAATQESTPIKKDDVEKMEVVDEECPNSALTVLSDDGQPITCSSVRSCPQSTMKCMSVGKVSLCCEPLSSASSKEETLFIKDTPESSIRTPAQRKTAQSLFNPLKYVENDAKLLQKDQHKEQTKPNSGIIYGEKELSTLHTSSAVASGTVIKKANITSADLSLDHIIVSPRLGNKSSTLQVNTTPKKEETTQQPTVTVSSTRATTTIVDVDINSTVASIPNVDVDIEQTEKPRAQGIPTAHEKDSQFEYKPHSSGGYALSEKTITTRPPLQGNAKKIARKFLIDQIKRGWPYDDSFYRPNEEVEFVRSGNRLAAVHFPN